MGIGQIIQKVAGGVGTAARAVQAASKAVDAPFQQAPAQDLPAISNDPRAWNTPYHVLTPTADGGFTLPNIDEPTIKDAEGNDVPNPAYIPKDHPDYADASDTHKAFAELDRIHQENAPHVDFAKEYQNILAQMKADAAAPRHGNALSAFAIGLGGGSAAQENYQKTNSAEDQVTADAADKALQFKKSLVDAHVKQLVDEGNWKEAIKANEVKTNLERRLGESAAEREFNRKKALNEQLIQGRVDVANIRAQEASRRASAIASAHGLTGELLKSYMKKAGEMIAAHKGIIDDPQQWDEAMPGMFDQLTAVAEGLSKLGTPKAAPAGKMVHMYKDGVPNGKVLTPEEFAKHGGAAAAEKLGYTFKLQ